MKNTIITAVALFCLALMAGLGRAQAPRPAGFGQGVGRPGISPYLNLTRGGDPAINYYGLVRPQIAAGKAFQELGSSIIDLESSISAQPVQTGINASFMTHQSYFMNNGPGGNMARPSTSSAGAAPPRRGR